MTFASFVPDLYALQGRNWEHENRMNFIRRGEAAAKRRANANMASIKRKGIKVGTKIEFLGEIGIVRMIHVDGGIEIESGRRLHPGKVKVLKT